MIFIFQIEAISVFVDPASIGPQRSIISILKAIGPEMVAKKQLEIEKVAPKLQYSVVSKPDECMIYSLRGKLYVVF